MPAKAKSDFTSGPLFWRITVFAIPLILSALLQIFYNMADSIVVGQFSSNPTALASVSSTTSVVNFIVNFVVGISAGAGVVIGRSIGAKDDSLTSRSVHTTFGLSVILGLAMGVLGITVSAPVLDLLGTKPELMDGALLYFRIICVGIPFQTVYNYCAAIQRSAGNSKIALYVLGFTGLINIAFNLIFVIFFDMSVDGVALATVIAHILSAVLVTASLMRRTDACKLVLKKTRIEAPILKDVLRLGMPAGISSGTFAFGNMIMTSAFNTLSTATIYAHSVVSSTDNLVATFMNAYSHATVTFASQNFGAKKHPRIVKSYVYSLIWAVSFGVIGGQLALHFSDFISSLFISSTNPLYHEVISEASKMLAVTLNLIFFLPIMNISSAILRSLGYSMTVMIACICGVVGIRISWILFFFPLERFNTGAGLLISFPLSWGVTALILGTLAIIFLKKTRKKFDAELKTIAGSDD